MVNIRQLLVQKLFGIHSAPSQTQAEIQRVYTGLGAEFSQPLTDANITFAIKREPVAHRIVFAVAHDIFDNWFTLEPLEEGVAQRKTNWMTINEIRQMEGLGRLPGADIVLGLSKPQNGYSQNISSATSRRKLELERKFRKPVDMLLAERIATGKSVNKICKELGIGKQTFYS